MVPCLSCKDVGNGEVLGKFPKIIDQRRPIMKRFCAIAIFMAALMFFATSVSAAEQSKAPAKKNFYVGVLGGYALPQSINDAPNNGRDAISFDIPVNNGYLLGVKGGWLPKFGKGYFATELEYNIVRYDADSNKTYPEKNQSYTDSLDATFTANNFFLNFILRYPETIFHPYIGIGPGWSWFNIGSCTQKTYKNGVYDSSLTLDSKSSNQFIYQVMLGIDVDVTDSIGVGLGYKFSQVKPSYNGGDPNRLWNDDLNVKNHVITLGVKYSF
jgi:opacity protein-like surface antigen